MHGVRCALHAANCKLYVASCKLQVVCCNLQLARCMLHAACCIRCTCGCVMRAVRRSMTLHWTCPTRSTQRTSASRPVRRRLRPATQVQHATCTMQHATCNVHGAPCNVQHATCTMQHARCNMQRARCNMQRARCNLQHARRNLQRARSVQHSPGRARRLWVRVRRVMFAVLSRVVLGALCRVANVQFPVACCVWCLSHKVAHSCIVAGLGACCPGGVALRCAAILRCTGRGRPPAHGCPFNGFRVNACDSGEPIRYSLYACTRL